MMIWMSIFFLVASLLSAFGSHVAFKTFYTAAVLEHARVGTENDSATDVIQQNLHIYRKAAEVAGTKGADIIVFPEYGIFPPGDRPLMKDFLENIPDPKKIRTNPCQEPQEYSNRPILLALSCMAKQNSIVVVANTGDIQTCDGDPQCPDDGAFHFNANVAFDRDGNLLMKYHKEHLFYEYGMDMAREEQDPTFETDFGKFATYICFEIIFNNMSIYAQQPDIDAIMFSTMWLNSAPQYTSIHLFQGWAMGNNATLISANIQLPGYSSIGSGMFHPDTGTLAYTFNPDGISKLVVARVPKSGFRPISTDSSTTAITSEMSWSWNNDFTAMPQVCSRKLLNDTEDIYNVYRCFEEITTNYTFMKLTNLSANMEVCNNGMCCTLDYAATSLPENFYLGIFNGTYHPTDKYSWAEENCVLVTCEAVGNNPCATFPLRSDTSFNHVKLRANFTTNYVYPSVIENDMRLVPLSEWEFELPSEASREATINFQSQEGKSLIVVGFKARCYERDPPFRR